MRCVVASTDKATARAKPFEQACWNENGREFPPVPKLLNGER